MPSSASTHLAYVYKGLRYQPQVLLLRSQARAEAGHAASSAKAAAQDSLEAAEAAAVAAKEAVAAAAEQLSRPVVAAGRQIRRQAGNARDVAERAAHAGGAKVQMFHVVMAFIVNIYNMQRSRCLAATWLAVVSALSQPGPSEVYNSCALP